MKVLVGAFNQEKALVGAFSVITNLLMELFETLHQDRGDRGQREADGEVRGVRQEAGRPQQPLQAQEDPQRGQAAQVSILREVSIIIIIQSVFLDFLFVCKADL